ncbi:MAG: hypothetical protein KDA72_23345, partial [Planctomycetales bacterium]|nr:hypothetical protein [Planctomycetales bacterium]
EPARYTSEPTAAGSRNAKSHGANGRIELEPRSVALYRTFGQFFRVRGFITALVRPVAGRRAE